MQYRPAGRSQTLLVRIKPIFRHYVHSQCAGGGHRRRAPAAGWTALGWKHVLVFERLARPNTPSLRRDPFCVLRHVEALDHACNGIYSPSLVTSLQAWTVRTRRSGHLSQHLARRMTVARFSTVTNSSLASNASDALSAYDRGTPLNASSSSASRASWQSGSLLIGSLTASPYLSTSISRRPADGTVPTIAAATFSTTARSITAKLTGTVAVIGWFWCPPSPGPQGPPAPGTPGWSPAPL
jgi:hypothetical protein